MDSRWEWRKKSGPEYRSGFIFWPLLYRLFIVSIGNGIANRQGHFSQKRQSNDRRGVDFGVVSKPIGNGITYRLGIRPSQSVIYYLSTGHSSSGLGGQRIPYSFSTDPYELGASKSRNDIVNTLDVFWVVENDMKIGSWSIEPQDFISCPQPIPTLGHWGVVQKRTSLLLATVVTAAWRYIYLGHRGHTAAWD